MFEIIKKLFRIYVIKLFLYFIDKNDLKYMSFENDDENLFKNDEKIKYWRIINSAVYQGCDTEICNLCGIIIYAYRGASQDKRGFTCANCSLNVCDYRCTVYNKSIKVFDRIFEDDKYYFEDNDINEIYNCPFCGKYKLNEKFDIIK